MSEDFKRKLEAYNKGKLSGPEKVEVEKELDKMEKETEMEENKGFNKMDKKQKKILKRSKWKARVQTVCVVLGLFLVFSIVTTILTGVYYSWGKPDRVDVFSNVIDNTLTVTDPYGEIGGTSSNTNAYFGMEATRDLNKLVGNETIKVGEIKTDFLFSMMSYPEREDFGKVSETTPGFTYPGVGERGMSDWDKLEKLPEGTVVSAYLSFSELAETGDVLKRFEGKDMELVWLAVDTGFEAKDENPEGVIFEPIGFPSYPIWHDDDMILDSKEEEKGLFGTRTVSESHSSPDYDEGDQEIIHKQFLKTLYFLKKHEEKANKFYFGNLNLSKRIDYLEHNGFKHYGVVLTGPTKEVLKLKKETWSKSIEVDEVSFWSWNE
ncbi:anti-sigma factor [Peribacillus sp. NPDC097675]|uniref:anti-sigma factor n=1 Tax=Peribacillus sp. NPDC097675 TaxID=3390618 RepID=UPI003D04287B